MNQQTEAKAKTTRIELSLKENFDLCKLLTERQQTPGETYEQIATEANHVLSTSRINLYHVKSRYEALGLKLKPASGTDSDRIMELEVKVARLSDLMYRSLSSDASRHPVILAALVDEFGAGK